MTLTPGVQRRLFTSLSEMREQLSIYQEQIATGKKARSYSELGIDRTVTINARRVVAGLEGYQNTIRDVSNRLNAMEVTLNRFSSINQEVKTLTNDRVMRLNAGGQTLAQTNAKLYADEFLGHLNSDYAGRKMFSGRDLTEDAVELSDVILNGDGAKDGLITVINERRQADLGASNLGRLTTNLASDTITVAEDAVHDFGFKLNTISTTSSAIAVSAPTGSPQSGQLQFTGVPTEGDVVSLRFNLPDGTVSSVRLVATAGTPGPNQFQIGTDAATTAANFKTALDISIESAARSDLAAASNVQAAEDFFGDPPQRVSGTPATATTLVDGTESNTVFWYKGEDDGDSARVTAMAVIDDGQRIGYGVRANETGISKSLQGLLTMAAVTFSSSDASASSHYSALMDRVRSTLEDANTGADGISSIRAELGTVNSIMNSAKQRHVTKNALMENAISDVENVSIEEVAAKLLDTQTKLQASYQVTATISRLSLMDYLS